MPNVRGLFTVAAMKNWLLVNFDVNNAFLQGDLKETTYIESPPGYANGVGLDVILKLPRSVYGLKQAPCACTTAMEKNLKLSRGVGKLLKDHTFYKSVSGSLIYLTHTEAHIVYAAQVVSQIIEVARSTHLDNVKRLL
ncbi:unnamed protein product [Linum trigynum]|uniref:Reverse transcriptase Ty1/copia-type domain-containing protein n=1 Tax=Linum trigynum TaxID=586398 RepID=A0AAV2E6D6_9ROSI